MTQARVSHRLEPQFLTVSMQQYGLHDKHMPEQKAFNAKDQDMCLDLKQSNASKARLFSELAQFKQSKDEGLESLKCMKERRLDDVEENSITKIDRMNKLCELHTDIVMNPMFSKKRKCCQLRDDFLTKDLIQKRKAHKVTKREEWLKANPKFGGIQRQKTIQGFKTQWAENSML